MQNKVNANSLSEITANLAVAPLSLVDTGVVTYITNGSVVRVCSAQQAPFYRQLFASGLIDQLLQEGLIPDTKILDSSLSGDESFAFEQLLIKPVIYPYEWSPEMLRSAALCTLRVNEVAHQYGYQLRDAHPYNVVFSHATPLFVDIGSFIEQAVGQSAWIAEDEFQRCFVHPLALYAKGLSNLFKTSFVIGVDSNGPEKLVALSLFYAFMGPRLCKLLRKIKYGYRTSRALPQDKIQKYVRSLQLARLLHGVAKSPVLPFRRTSINKLRTQICSLRLFRSSAWSDYHSKFGLCQPGGDIQLTERMRHVVQLVAQSDVTSVLEIAGNQGVLARALSRLGNVKTMICTDYDTHAIDVLHVNASKRAENVFSAVFDIMGDLKEHISLERSLRLRADLVIAMAITHHLMLGQSYKLESILKTFSMYTNKYLIVEFMPLGLWDGSREPMVPDWYHEQYFEGKLSELFVVKEKTVLEPNRILYFAEKIV